MTIRDAAIEAAKKRLLAGIRERDDDAAALRFISGWLSSYREAIAQEIEADLYSTNGYGLPYIDGRKDAARIVRGSSVTS